MFLKRTIFQLVTRSGPPEQAAEFARLGYMQWLAGLPGAASYHEEALRARAMAEPFRGLSPAVAVFCDLLTASLEMPPRPLPLTLPARRRRGGAKARRARS